MLLTEGDDAIRVAFFVGMGEGSKNAVGELGVVVHDGGRVLDVALGI